MLSVCVDESKIISYIISILNNPDLALRIASRCNLPGAEKLYMDKFMQLLQSGSFNEAAKVAANSPQVRLIYLFNKFRPATVYCINDIF